MKFDSEETIKILEYAAKREMETRDFYRKCRDQARIEGTRRVLESLVQDEERHYRIVTDLIDNARKAVKPAVETMATQNAAERIKTAFPHHVASTDFEAESTTVGSMLAIALENEKESFNNYASAAAEAENPDARKVFEYLAEEENKHYTIVSNLIDYLDHPSAWLYEEENLIFRRG